MQNEADSIFSHDGEPFSVINRCGEPYVNEVESQLANPPQNLVEVCGDNVVCLIDGLCGDETDAANALRNEALVTQMQGGTLVSRAPALTGGLQSLLYTSFSI